MSLVAVAGVVTALSLAGWQRGSGAAGLEGPLAGRGRGLSRPGCTGSPRDVRKPTLKVPVKVKMGLLCAGRPSECQCPIARISQVHWHLSA